MTAAAAEITSTEEITAATAKIQDIETNNVTSSVVNATNSNVAQDRIQEDVDDSSDDDNVEDTEIAKSNTQNGSIVIQNPEYLRISWTTDNRKYRFDSHHNNTENDVNRVQIATAKTSRRVRRTWNH